MWKVESCCGRCSVGWLTRMLALDEPTTNLDTHNIGSLCEAIKEIIDERRQARSTLH